MRFSLQHRGKSESVRVCYTDFAEYEVTYLITVFTKKTQENLTGEKKYSENLSNLFTMPIVKGGKPYDITL